MRVSPALTAAIVLAVASVGRPAPPIGNGKITPSIMCGTCHRDIYQMWHSSAHADAMEDVVFFEAYRETEAHDAATARLCLGCHAPLTQVNPDPTLAAQATWDGVSCDACHSLVSVELAPGGAKQTFEPGPVKRGPIRDAVSMGHEVAYFPLHTSGLVCAGCHEFQNAEGTPIITTYTEWQAPRRPPGQRFAYPARRGAHREILVSRVARRQRAREPEAPLRACPDGGAGEPHLAHVLHHRAGIRAWRTLTRRVG